MSPVPLELEQVGEVTVVRVTAEAPESDFEVVSPGTIVQIHVISTNKEVVAKVSRRAPAADPGTRTVHFELDVPDPERTIPVGTTAELRIEVGDPIATVDIPLAAAVVRGSNASVFVVEGDVARARVVPVKGELAGRLYVDLKPGTTLIVPRKPGMFGAIPITSEKTAMGLKPPLYVYSPCSL